MSNVDGALPVRPLPRRQRLLRVRRGDFVFFVVAATVVVLDQLTKAIVRANLELGESWPADGDSFIRIIHVVNSGAAFGILPGQTAFLIVTGALGLIAILLYYVYPPMDHGLIRVALAMQLGGAIGNLTDRVRFGEVTDFIDVGRWPTFNVADASISISVVTVLAFFALQELDATKQQPTADARDQPVGDD